MYKELFLIRHAPSIPAGFLYGRTDADIAAPTPAQISHLSKAIEPCAVFLSSPAKRALKSFQAVCPDKVLSREIPEMWEQSFGDWEGMKYADLPDIGSKSGAELAEFRPPNGESFADLCARVQPAIQRLLLDEPAEKMALFAHAGVIRAVLALALGDQIAALKFEIGHLSLTQIRALPKGQFSIVGVNKTG